MRNAMVCAWALVACHSAVALAQTPVCHINPDADADADPDIGPGLEPGHGAGGRAAPAVDLAILGPGTALLDRAIEDLEQLGHGGVVKGDDLSHHVAFTFDDGPRYETTPLVLDALDRYDIPATFFVVGWRLAGDRESTHKNVAVLRDIVARGHMVGNHTFHHKKLSESTLEEMRREIDDNTAILTELLGYRPHAFRPPYGVVNRSVRQHLRREGLTEIRWNIDTLDFYAGSARTLRKRALSMILERGGGIVLLHDTKDATASNIAGILDDLERENCRRLESGTEPPIIPVSIHYFIRELDGTPRPIPAHAARRTRQYVEHLPGRCQARKPSPVAVSSP